MDYEVRYDEDQWFHVLQAETFQRRNGRGPTAAGYFYVIPANINPAEQDSWKKSVFYKDGVSSP